MNTLFTEKPSFPKAKRGRPRSETPKKRKAKIPTAIQEAIWVQKMGRVFEGKCLTTWCPNIITVFDFHAGHNIPESKGGTIDPENLYPICARCNLSMGDRYTFIEWCSLSHQTQTQTQTQTETQTQSNPVEVVPKKQRKPWFCFS